MRRVGLTGELRYWWWDYSGGRAGGRAGGASDQGE